MDYNLKDLGLIRIVIIDKSNPSVMDKNLFHLMNTIWWNKTLLILGRRMYIIWGKAIKYAVSNQYVDIAYKQQSLTVHHSPW